MKPINLVLSILALLLALTLGIAVWRDSGVPSPGPVNTDVHAVQSPAPPAPAVLPSPPSLIYLDEAKRAMKAQNYYLAQAWLTGITQGEKDYTEAQRLLKSAEMRRLLRKAKAEIARKVRAERDQPSYYLGAPDAETAIKWRMRDDPRYRDLINGLTQESFRRRLEGR